MIELKSKLIGITSAFAAVVAAPTVTVAAPIQPLSGISNTAKTPAKSFFGNFNTASNPENWKYVFAGDSSHETAAAFQFPVTADIMDKFAKDGGRHIFFEIPTIMQLKIDALYNGDISTEEFVKTGQQFKAKDGSIKSWGFSFSDEEITRQKMEAIAQTVLKGKTLGIHVYAADERSSDSPEIMDAIRICEEYERVRQAFTEEFVERNKGRIALAQQNGTLKQIEDEGTKELRAKYPELSEKQKAADALIEKNQTNDTELAAFIRKYAGNDRAMVIFGSAHLQKTKADSLYSLLSNEGVSRINIYTDANQAIQLAKMDCIGVKPNQYNFASRVFTLDNKRFQNIDYTNFGCPAPSINN